MNIFNPTGIEVLLKLSMAEILKSINLCESKIYTLEQAVKAAKVELEAGNAERALKFLNNVMEGKGLYE
jgi:hypothetical protein